MEMTKSLECKSLKSTLLMVKFTEITTAPILTKFKKNEASY